MNTREKLLQCLEENRGIYLSGQEMAGKLGVSRAAVWKAVRALETEGYVIDAITNRGYCLSPQTDILSAQGIEKYLQPHCPALTMTVLPQTSSTNAVLRQEANNGAAEGRIILANRQEAGRGRLGRAFFSPPNSGVYLSLLLRPRQLPASQAVHITTMAAVALCEAIEELTPRPAGIKWINDIFMEGKKVCGILTEAALDLENTLLDYAVLGVGVNLYAPAQGFPPELQAIAGAVLPAPLPDGKNRLAAAFLNRFFFYYQAAAQGQETGYVERYRERSLALGQQIQVLRAGASRPALALHLDEDCGLRVRYEDGTEETLTSGEISIRL